MKVQKWITVNSKGGCRLTASRPGLSWDEISIRIELNLPIALFTRPRLEAKITIPDEAVRTEVIDSVVTDNVQEAIEKATGLTFSISVIHPEAEE